MSATASAGCTRAGRQSKFVVRALVLVLGLTSILSGCTEKGHGNAVEACAHLLGSDWSFAVLKATRARRENPDFELLRSQVTAVKDDAFDPSRGALMSVEQRQRMASDDLDLAWDTCTDVVDRMFRKSAARADLMAAVNSK